MPRPVRKRKVCIKDLKSNMFEPVGGQRGRMPVVNLNLDEYEVIRLVDLEGLTHEECAEHMDISRTTVTEIYESARHKLADFIVNAGHLNIVDGSKAKNVFECPGGLVGCGDDCVKLSCKEKEKN